MIKLPGLIDVHVHLRDPGQTNKEDFFTGTSAALAGGFTTVLDMPNNKIPVTTFETLQEKIKLAKQKSVSDIGFYAGSLGENLEELMKMEPYVFGLKLYLNKTTGNFIVDEKKLVKIFTAWKSSKPVLVHAEDDVLSMVIDIARKTKKRIHICHVSNKLQLELIIKAKKNNLSISCGVTAHHLFLTKDDTKVLKSFAFMKPELMSKNDQKFLWKNLKWIDIFESDHAPHSIEEKKSDNPPFGVPGLETTLALLLTAVSKKKLEINDIINKCYKNPKKIFNIPNQPDSYVDVDMKSAYTINGKKLLTKCGWSPFEGWIVKGKVKNVFIRGKKVYEDGKILVKPGSGKYVTPTLL